MRRKIFIFVPLILSLAGCSRGVCVKDGVDVLCDGTLVGTLSCGVEGGNVKTDCLAEKMSESLLCVDWTVTALEDIDSLRLTPSFERADSVSFAMVPSVSYNGNGWGRGKEPKGFDFSCSWRRTPIPGASYTEAGGFAAALWSDVPDGTDFSVSLSGGIHRFIIPEEEMPFSYVKRDGYAPGYARKMSLRKGESLHFLAYLCVAPSEPGHRAVRHFLDEAWAMSLSTQTLANCASPSQLWERGIHYAKNSLWVEEGPYKGLSIGLTPSGESGWMQRPHWKYEAGWCGQNISFANSLLQDYRMTSDSTSLRCSLDILRTWSSPQTVFPNGLFVTNYDYILDNTENPRLDACNLGTAALQFFEASERLSDIQGVEALRERLESVSFGILDFVRSDQQENGCYGKGWTSDGDCISRDGTVGAFLIAPMILAAKISGCDFYMDSARKAYDFYMGEFNRLGFTSAGALDTWCIDKESSAPLLRAALMFYEQNGEQSFLDDAQAIGYYLSTWLWHYEGHYPATSDFSRYGFSTFGTTAVSVQHHHLDPYALVYVPELLRLSELTGRDCWRQKAIAIWHGGSQLVSDGTLTMHGRLRPEGSQNEAFLHCNWGWNGNPGDVTLNDWLVAWPGAFRLETLRKTEEWEILR